MKQLEEMQSLFSQCKQSVSSAVIKIGRYKIIKMYLINSN